VVGFIADSATNFPFDCALSLTLYNTSRSANGTWLRLNTASESFFGDQSNNCSGYQYDDSGCAAETAPGQNSIKHRPKKTVINPYFFFKLLILPTPYFIHVSVFNI